MVAEQNSGTTSVNISDTLIQQNGFGIVSGNGAATVRIGRCSIYNNVNGFNFVGGGTIVSHGNNQIQGNGGSQTPSSTLSPGTT